MKILMAGSSGFLGTALQSHLRDAGHDVTRLVRSDPRGPDQARWDPSRGMLDTELVEQSDVVVNLAGAPIARWPWTQGYRRTLLSSRVDTTATLAEAIAKSARKPALINASGVDYYGHVRDQVTEESPVGETFLAGVCLEWEAATKPVSDSGARVAIARTGAVLDGSGGILKIKIIALPFKVGLGPRLGSGDQWLATVSLDDYLGIVTRLIVDDSMSGPYNVVAPVPATNAEFTDALGRALNRPTVLAVPGFALRAALGGLAEVPLGSIKAKPKRLIEAGYEFGQPTIDDQLAAAL